MQYGNMMKMLKGTYGALLAVTLAAGPSFGLTVDLAAVEAEWTPPGAAAAVAMWGFIEDTGVCPGAPVAWDVGPEIDVPAGDTELTIILRNCLAEDVSVFIPGQAKTTMPETFVDDQGRTRVRSFDATVAPGSTGIYTWNSPREGTYLYQSGTFVAMQVPKGLYGALVVRGASYPAAAREEILVYSEIDPVLNNNGAGARVNNYLARYFLINGDAYPATGSIAINTGEDFLLRFVNGGLRTYVPTLQGMYMHVIAEDGGLYPFPSDQYQIELPPAKTMDVLINAGTDGRYALFDRGLRLTNGGISDGSGGGMLVYIQAGAAAGAPVAAPDNYSVAEDAALTVPAPGVLENDTAGTGGTMTASLASDASFGTLALVADGSFTYTPNADFNGNDIFTYYANDGGPNSNVATVTIAVTAVNDPPAAVDDAATTSPNTAVIIDVLQNDSDVDGNLDPMSVSILADPANGTAVANGDGTITYLPGTGFSGSDSFTYQVCDTDLECASATVTVTVEEAANIAPTANDDTAQTPRNTPLVNFDIVANDSDPDGTIDPTTVVIVTGTTTSRGGSVTNNGDGTITYSPPTPGFRGTDTFTYTVNDNDGATSNQATVRINVVK